MISVILRTYRSYSNYRSTYLVIVPIIILGTHKLHHDHIYIFYTNNL